MPAIKRILIKGTSGYVPVDKAYKDKITIERSGIRYDFNPFEPTESNMPIRWSYRTTNPAFGELFDSLAQLMPGILNTPVCLFEDDATTIELSVTYDDGSRVKQEFWAPTDDIQECFAIVRRMLPTLEEVPCTLRVFSRPVH